MHLSSVVVRIAERCRPDRLHSQSRHFGTLSSYLVPDQLWRESLRHSSGNYLSRLSWREPANVFNKLAALPSVHRKLAPGIAVKLRVFACSAGYQHFPPGKTDLLLPLSSDLPAIPGRAGCSGYLLSAIAACCCHGTGGCLCSVDGNSVALLRKTKRKLERGYSLLAIE